MVIRRSGKIRCDFIHYVDIYMTVIECGVSPDDRRECGFSGIDRTACLARDCCFDDSQPDSFWCFLNKDRAEGELP